MNAKEAKEIVARGLQFIREFPELAGRGQGYMDALNGPEIKALEKAVARFLSAKTQNKFSKWNLHTALSEFRETVKP